ncbi:MAG: CvpA family protein [Lachnospira sp.]|nr:CvpA family protein [Lachnospira sp.]
MSWVLIAVIALFALFGFIGWKKGIIEIVVSLAALIVTMLAAVILAPIVFRGLKATTEVDESMQKITYNVIMEATQKDDENAGASGGNSDVAVDEATQDKIDDIESSKGDITKYTEKIANNAAQVSKYADKIIDKLNLTEDMSKQLKSIVSENNIRTMVMNNDIVTIINQTDGSMKSIVVSIASIKLADIVLNAIVHIVVFILVFIGVRIIVSFTGLVSKLPVIKQANKLGGLALGLVEGLIAVWVLFVIITAAGSTSWAADALADIGSNGFLSFLYDLNPIVKSIFKV